MTQAFLYKWTHKLTNKWYIGSRTAKNCHINDGYICSSKIVKPMILENPSDWKRDVLVIGSSKYIRDIERKLLKILNAKGNATSFNQTNAEGKAHNTTLGRVRIHKGDCNKTIYKLELDAYLQKGWNKGFSKATKEKMKINHRDVSGINNPMHGTSRKGEDNPFYNKKHSAETLKVLRKPKSAEHKNKLSIAKKGKNNPMFGKKQSIDTCEKRSKSLKGRIPWNKGLKGVKSLKDLKI